MHGILTAIESIASQEDRSYDIFTDPKSVMQALAFYDSRHPVVLKILEWLFLLKCIGREVSFCWVSAHAGVIGNEKADSLAKEGATNCPLQMCCSLWGLRTVYKI